MTLLKGLKMSKISLETVNTGGNKEFCYGAKDIERIESYETGPTKEFKEAYNKWINEPFYKRIEFWGIIFTVVVLILVYFWFIK